MSVGPVEYIAIAFPGNKFSGKIIPAIKELQDAGTIRVLDIVIISKDRPRHRGQEPARPRGHRGHRRSPGPEQHGRPDDLGERLGREVRQVVARR